MVGVMGADRQRRSLDTIIRALARDFRRFTFGTQQTWDGTAIAAIRRKPDEPGLYAVITPDPEEMRAALREDEESPPGG